MYLHVGSDIANNSTNPGDAGVAPPLVDRNRIVRTTLDLVQLSSFDVPNCSRWDSRIPRSFVRVSVLLYFTGREMIKMVRGRGGSNSVSVCVCEALRVIHHSRVIRILAQPRHVASNQARKKMHVKWATHSHAVKGHWERVRSCYGSSVEGRPCTSFAVAVRIRQMNVGGVRRSIVICPDSAVHTKREPHAVITFTRISHPPEHTCV
jgi:hypothetical protein